MRIFVFQILPIFFFIIIFFFFAAAAAAVVVFLCILVFAIFCERTIIIRPALQSTASGTDIFYAFVARFVLIVVLAFFESWVDWCGTRSAWQE